MARIKGVRGVRIVTPPDLFLRFLEAEFPGTKVVKEYRFHPMRKWRFDYAFPDYQVAVEVDGAVWTQGRHTRPQGYINDLEKLNTATSMGWRVVRITTDQRFYRDTIQYIGDTINSVKRGENEKG